MNTATRVFIAALLVGLLYCGTYMVRAGLKPPNVKFPDRDFDQFPMNFGQWQGRKAELDPKVAIRLGAKTWVDREYRNEEGQPVSLHIALFADPDLGVFHNPINCHRTNGWTMINEARPQLQVAEGSSIRVSLSTWRREGEQILVMYWYQLGEHFIFDRFGLGRVRWEMGGKQTWPALIKVLLVTSAPDPKEARPRLESVARYTYGWINQPTSQAPAGGPNE